MKKLVSMVLAVAAAMGLAGCSQNNAQKTQAGDPMVQHYMHRRSEMLGQRQRLAAVYGPTSPQVAETDRQIALIDQALSERRRQMIEQEAARQEIQRQKLAADQPVGEPASQPAANP